MFCLTANLALPTLILALFCVQDAGSQEIPADSTCQHTRASYFLIQVDIQPTTFDFDCDATGVEKVRKLIERVSDRKFEKYFHETKELAVVEVVDEQCGGPGNATGDEDGGPQVDGFFLQPAGWAYTSSSKCTFCIGDMDVNFDAGPKLKPDNIKPLLEAAENEARLQAKLEKKLTRVLTRKINHHKKSCLVGSESSLIVTLTPVGNRRPTIVCPP